MVLIPSPFGHPPTRLVALVALVLALCAPLAVVADDACHRYPLNLDNVWLQSIASSSDGSVLAVDPAELRVLKLSPLPEVRHASQRLTEAFTGIDDRPSSARFVPTLIQRRDGTFFIGNGGDELLEVEPGSNVLQLKGGLQERNFKVVEAVRPLEASKGAGRKLIAIFAWALTADDHVIAFADAAYPGDKYKRGFVWFPRSDPSAFRFIREVKVMSEEDKLYFIMHPYLATLRDKTYFLAMEREPVIYEYDGDSVRPLAFPEDLQVRPSLPPKEGATTFPDLYAALGDSVSPVGIYAWRDSVWLLGRKPRNEGGTEWTLSRISLGDAETASRVEYTLYLPTTSEHIAVAPGEDRWSVLEKGSVRALGRQDVKALMQLPADWMADRNSPLSKQRSPDFCRSH